MKKFKAVIKLTEKQTVLRLRSDEFETIEKDFSSYWKYFKQCNEPFFAEIKMYDGTMFQTMKIVSFEPEHALSFNDNQRIKAARKIKAQDWQMVELLEQQAESEIAREILKAIRIGLYHADEQENI